jgi:hypothetical protein
MDPVAANAAAAADVLRKLRRLVRPVGSGLMVFSSSDG